MMLRNSAGIVLTIAVVGCGSAEFKEFSPPGSKVKVLMPGTPKAETQKVMGMLLKTYACNTSNGSYFVSINDMPLPKGEAATTTQARLDGAVQGMISNTNAQLLESKPITLQKKYPGRDVTAKLPDGKGSLRARIYVVDSTLYQTLVIGKKDWVAGPDTQKFLSSFKLAP